jgi:hypothetical protein
MIRPLLKLLNNVLAHNQNKTKTTRSPGHKQGTKIRILAPIRCSFTTMKVLTRKLWYTNARGSHDSTSVHGSPFSPRASSPLKHATKPSTPQQTPANARKKRFGARKSEKEKKTYDSKADLRKRGRGRASPAPRPTPSEAPGSESAPSARRRSSAAHASSSAATIAVDGLPPRFPPPPPPPPSSGLPPRPAARPAILSAAASHPHVYGPLAVAVSLSSRRSF